MFHSTARRSIANTRASAARLANAEHLARLERQAKPTVTEQCWSCNARVQTDGNIQPVQCDGCRQRFLDSALHDLNKAVSDLRSRCGAFAALSAEQVNQQLRTLGIGQAAALPNVCELSDDDLIELAAGVASEIERRAMQVELSPAARRAVEQSVIDDGIEDRFDSQFFQNAY